MSDGLAPIALFVYDRPSHTKLTLDALLRNQEASQSDLYIFSDAAKTESDIDNVLKVRNVINTVSGFRNIEIIEKSANLGLASSIIQGVTLLCEQFGKVIVLEDDLVTSPHFLKYMNEGLNRYESNDRVMQIAGYNFSNDIRHKTDAVLFDFISSWGWATWQSAWQYFDEDANDFIKIKKSKMLQRRFNLNNHYPYYKMLLRQQSGKTQSWAIRWYLSVFFQDGLVLYPKSTLVENIGIDGTGQNCLLSDIDEANINQDFIVKSWPEECVLCDSYEQVLETLPKPKINISMLFNYVAKRLLRTSK